MAVVAVSFEHLGRSFTVGDVLPDDDPLVELAPHLFEHPPLEISDPVEPARVRGPVVDWPPIPPKPTRRKPSTKKD